jgi:hypothetical protein
MPVTRVFKGGGKTDQRPAPMMVEALTGASARRPLPLPPAACILLLAAFGTHEWLLENEKENEKERVLFPFPFVTLFVPEH